MKKLFCCVWGIEKGKEFITNMREKVFFLQVVKGGFCLPRNDLKWEKKIKEIFFMHISGFTKNLKFIPVH